jgi:hypothetical protein
LAQSQTKLLKLAKERETLWKIQRAEAESLALARNLPIRVEKPDGTTFELQRFENGIPKYYITDNLNAAKTISTNKVWSGGGYGLSLTGNGVLLGEWDGGKVLTTHQEFGGRVTSNQNAPNFHSTHVAGTMVGSGVNSSAKGMAPQASLIEYDFTNDESEMATEAAGGLKVSNHSYGLITGWRFDYYGDGKWTWFGDTAISEVEDYSFGFYDAQAESWDNIAFNAPYYLICKSAGNDRNEGPSGAVTHWFFKNGVKTSSTKARNRDGAPSGFDCVAAAGVAKNILTVGAIDDMSGGYVNPGGVIMSSFSCFGPTDDGRIKPDIVANGVSLFSALETANNAYGTLSGTSMATPNASGSIGLLLEHQNNLHGATPLRASTLKAIVINTADEAGLNNGPDYAYGWGVMNTLKAVQLMTADTADGAGSHVREMVLNQGNTIEFDISMDGTQPLKATICWTDPAGTPVSAALDPPNLMLENDLDLRIIKKKDLTQYYPWVLNPASPTTAATTGDNFRDNVEQVYIQSPERAEYTVRVTHKGTLNGFSQNVSFAISGNVKSIGPIISATPTSIGANLIPGAFIEDSIKVKNLGDTTLVFEAVPAPSGLWLSVVHNDSGAVAPLDSMYVRYRIDAAALSQWTEYNGTLTIEGAEDPFVIPATLQTLGPQISATPTYLPIDVDSGATGYDTLKIKNNGYIPLSFTVDDSSGTLPVWLTLNSDNGTIAPNDSALIILTANAISQPVGNYSTVLEITSNDSMTGTVLRQVDLHVGTRNEFDVSMNNHWNLISLPVTPFIYATNALFPTATTPGYSFNGSNYDTADTLEKGSGYWLKFGSAQTVTIDGYTFTEETVAVHNGWNILGSLSSTVPSASITSIPPGIITSGFFAYNPGYTMSDSIRPGRGYWVQTNQAGQIVFNTLPVIEPKVSAEKAISPLNSLTIEDIGGNHQNLYFGDASRLGVSLESFVMPPPAPAGSFDARFVSGKMLEGISKSKDDNREFGISIQPVSNSVTIRWKLQSNDKRVYALRDENGVTYALDQKGSVKLTFENKKQHILTLTYGEQELPKEYSLSQNFPNPFNPVTKIQFELPEPGDVTIKVYNLLGNEVATIVNGTQEAGYHSVEFEGAGLPSGVYIYKMQSGKFNSMKKMMLLR